MTLEELAREVAERIEKVLRDLGLLPPVQPEAVPVPARAPRRRR